jgi:hypothetical protein
MFEMARRYCQFHAAAASVLLWAESRKVIEGFFARGDWLPLTLRRILHSMRPAWDIGPPRNLDAVSSELIHRFRERILFSVVPIRLANRDDASAKRMSVDRD